MRTTGVEINGLAATFVTIEGENDDINLCHEFCSKITLENHKESKSIWEFCELIKSKIDLINPNRIGIIERQSSGEFASGPLSFKVEGLIQSYRSKNVELINSASIRAFLKKKQFTISPKFKYQLNALNLALYLLKK
ncbi:MAG: DUF3010 family protein [Bacteroidales bacterium]|nr:DUF3010 family protein [Bacteroidales bacterium]